VTVYEPGDGLNTITGTAYTTKYTYDVLDRLRTVQQKGNTSDPAQWRNRSFSYNSLYMQSATNPESGTITYAYDNDGNMTSKRDGGGHYISYCYDGLNRLIQKKYANDVNCTNPDVTYTYDVTVSGPNDPNPIGRRTAMTYGGTASYWTHDSMGRVTNARVTSSVSQLT